MRRMTRRMYYEENDKENVLFGEWHGHGVMRRGVSLGLRRVY
jgi:hypothetical protein